MPRKIQRWQTSIWKDAPHHIPLGNCKKKKKKKKTSRYHDMPFRMVSIQRTTSNAGKDVNQQELSFFGGGDAKW